MNRERKQSGFTLLEIIIVVFLLTIVTAVVLPSFSSVAPRDISLEAKSVASIIRHLDDTSRNTGTDALLTINLDVKTISYKSSEQEDSKDIGSLYSVETASSGLKEKGEVKIVFPPAGLLEVLRITLFEGPSYKDIIYNPYIGRVVIQDVTDERREKQQGQGR